MKSTFAEDIYLKALAKNGAYYVVIYPGKNGTCTYLDFKDRFKAWDAASKTAKSGLWCYIVDLFESDYPVIAYLSGYCNCR